MILIPAIDLKEGKCVRLSKGKEESSEVFNEDPISQAKFFEKEGCQRIHIVDLDSAFDKNRSNKSIILEIRKAISIEIQLGGGIRTQEEANFWINNGINFLVFGSLAITNIESFKKLAEKYPNVFYVSLDDFNGDTMIYGWTKKSGFKTNEIICKYNKCHIKGFVYTDISRDGMLQGINLKRVSECLSISNKPLIVGGGLSKHEELDKLLNLNNSLLEGVIAGKSFYLGKIDIRTANKTLNKI